MTGSPATAGTSAIALLDRQHPVVVARHMVAAATEYGLSAEELLAGTALTRADLDSPDAVVRVHDEVRIARAVLRHVPDAGTFGMQVGARFSVASLGLFGFAVLSSASLRDLLDVALRFFGLTCLHVDVVATPRDGGIEIVFDSTPIPRDVRGLFVAMDLTGIAVTVPRLAGGPIADHAQDCQVFLGHDVPDAFLPVLQQTPISQVRQTRGRTLVWLPDALLAEPLPQADRHTFVRCIHECERIVERHRARAGAAAQVRSLLIAVPGHMPSLEEVAAQLAVHPRTLRRRLAAESTTFRDLVTETRQVLAAELLTEVGLSVGQVARRLGYADPSAFSHAFTRWFGVGPSEYRRPGRSD